MPERLFLSVSTYSMLKSNFFLCDVFPLLDLTIFLIFRIIPFNEPNLIGFLFFVVVVFQPEDGSISRKCHCRRTVHYTHRSLWNMQLPPRPCAHDRVSKYTVQGTAMFFSIHRIEIFGQSCRMLRRDRFH